MSLENTYKVTLTNEAGESIEVNVKRMTVRNKIRLGACSTSAEIAEAVIDMVAPDVLDMQDITVDSLSRLFEAIEAKEGLSGNPPKSQAKAKNKKS